MACNQSIYPDRSPIILDSAAVSSLRFWPPLVRYITVGETAVVQLKGIKRAYSCSEILESRLASTSSHDTLLVGSQTRVKIPGTPVCPLDTAGLDTAFHLPPTPVSGISTLVLKTPDNRITDSARRVNATVTAEILVYVSDTTGRKVQGRYTFRDSTSKHPLRTLSTDSLSRCETLQGAVYTSSNDTLKVRFHRLVLDSTQHPTLTPCLGKHRDSLNVVWDRFLFPNL